MTTMVLDWVLLDAHDGIIALDCHGLVELVVTPIFIVPMVLILSIAAASLLLIQVEIELLVHMLLLLHSLMILAIGCACCSDIAKA